MFSVVSRNIKFLQDCCGASKSIEIYRNQTILGQPGEVFCFFAHFLKVPKRAHIHVHIRIHMYICVYIRRLSDYVRIYEQVYSRLLFDKTYVFLYAIIHLKIKNVEN